MPETISIFVVLLHFATGSIAVGDRGQPVGYKDLSDCKRAIPRVTARWAKSGYPLPEGVACWKLEIK